MKKFNRGFSVVRAIWVTTLLAFVVSMIPLTAIAAGDAFYPISGCRVMDSRKWIDPVDGVTPFTIPTTQAVGVYLNDSLGDIARQGGDASGCPAIPLTGVSAVTLTISAVSPLLPSNYSAIGYTTLVPFDDTGWTLAGLTPNDTNPLYTYDGPGVFAQAANMLFDKSTALISNTTTVANCDGCAWGVLLYTSAESHYIIDVVGYYSPIPDPPAP